MITIVTITNLRRALEIVARLAVRNTALPILQNIIMKTERGRLYIAATNLEIGASATIGAKIDEVGEIAVPAKTLADLMGTISSDTVSLTTKQNTLTVSGGSQTAKIIGTSTQEYPLIPKIEIGASVSLPASALRKSLLTALESAAISDTRPELSAVYLKCIKGECIIAATDSSRLVEHRLAYSGENDVEMIIPRNTVSEIVRIISDDDEKITLRKHENQVAVSGPGYEIISRLIESTYPEYHRLIPEKGQTRLLVNRHDLEQAIKLASLFSSSISDITLSCERSEILITAKNSDKGEARAKVQVLLKGEPFILSLNHRYFVDGLKIMPTEKVTIDFTGASGPLAIRPADDKKSLVYLLMPLRQ